MKKITCRLNLGIIKTLVVLVSISLFTISCSSDDDGFIDANGNTKKKYITRILDQGNNLTVLNVNYDSEGKVTSAESKNDTKYFSYGDNGDLKRVSGGGDNIVTSEIINEIHKGYEIGDVLQFDDKGNPTVLELYGEDYYGNREIVTAELKYDEKPFAFYYTLDAAGIIDVLYDVRLQFYAPQEIVLAKKLLPVNNPVKATVKDNNSQEVFTITVDYNYDQDNYPTSSRVIIIDDEGYADTENFIYTYK